LTEFLAVVVCRRTQMLLGLLRFLSRAGNSFCKLTFRREGGNLSFTLGLIKSSKNSVDVKKDWVTRKLLMGLGIVCRV
jgi:hypothetical protein